MSLRGLATVLFTIAAALCPGAALPQTTIGPPRGALVISGGYAGKAVMSRFIELAGGPDALIVIIPTADEGDSFLESSDVAVLKHFGARNLAILHTRSRDTANSTHFVEPLRRAGGVWIGGGRQWRLADAYAHTRTVEELQALLMRGGVIGGTSAGASIQSSYMVRGSPHGSSHMIAPGHEEGFGFLRDAAIDQHLLARGRQDDMLDVIERYPSLLGIGVDEWTALVVMGNRAEVVGRSKVAFYNAKDRGDDLYYFLQDGGVFDLGTRRVVSGTRLSPQQVLGPIARFRHWLVRIGTK